MEAQSMIEQVARSIDPDIWSQAEVAKGFVESAGHDWSISWEKSVHDAKMAESKTRAVRAIITLRNPTDDMVREGADTWERSGQAVKAEWRAMIDAALNEREKV